MIETNRLLLLPYTYELVDATLKGRNELETILGYKVSEEWPSPQYAKLIEMKHEKLQKAPGQSIWSRIVIEKESGMLIGEIGCKGGPDEKGEVEIGYGMVSHSRNKGYATELVTGLTKWLFNRPEVTKVKAECLETNPASARVLQKSGFLKTAQRDGMIYWEKFSK